MYGYEWLELPDVSVRTRPRSQNYCTVATATAAVAGARTGDRQVARPRFTPEKRGFAQNCANRSKASLRRGLPFSFRAHYGGTKLAHDTIFAPRRVSTPAQPSQLVVEPRLTTWRPNPVVAPNLPGRNMLAGLDNQIWPNGLSIA